MERRELTCIECPTGCTLTVTVEEGRVSVVDGHGCRRGRDYAVTEVERPERLVTTTIPTRGLRMPMAAVRTSRPIPRSLREDAMREIRRARLLHPVEVGDVIIANLLDTGVDVVATRAVE